MSKVVLVTGAAKRIGKVIAEYFHAHDYRVVVHYRHSAQDANALVEKLNAIRAHSAACIAADLDQCDQVDTLIAQSVAQFGCLDVLINNASTFYKTPVGHASLSDWDALMTSNLKAPFFLSQTAAPYLQIQNGCIVNMIDSHIDRPMRNYSIYSCAKAGLAMLTKSLAVELAPHIRVNAVAPGHVLWPVNADAFSDQEKKNIMHATPLARAVDPMDIAKAAYFLVENQSITGHTLCVDAGRSCVAS